MAAEGAPVVTAPREFGWRWLVLALAASLVASLVNVWPTSLALLGLSVRWALPLQSFVLLLLAGLGACAVAAWAKGGRVVPALAVGVGLALWIWRWPPAASGVAAFEAGWALVIAAVFGWVCVVSTGQSLLSRALLTVGAAGLLVIGLLTFHGSGGLAEFERSFAQEFLNRRTRSLALWQERVVDPSWISLGARVPALGDASTRLAQRLARASPPTPLVPALLVLETLAALALAWATWHRFTRVRLGPPLSRLSAFRFNDQLVWGLILGATLVLLPSLRGWQTAGMNILLVFGALHALRGLGVMVWWIPDGLAAVLLLVLLVCIPLLGPVQVLATVAVLALGLGLGDTWRDFRRTARPLRPNLRP